MNRLVRGMKKKQQSRLGVCVHYREMFHHGIIIVCFRLRIKEPYDPETIFQLDRYHIYQEILRKIRDKKAQNDIRSLFDEGKMDEMLEYIQTYATSIESPEIEDKSSEKARELYQYLSNNRKVRTVL